MKRVYVSWLIVFFISCSNRTGIPADVLPVDSMQSVMRDMVYAEEYSTMYVNRDTANHDKGRTIQNLMESVFTLHHINRADFKKSLLFYESRPDLNKKIFDSLAAYGTKHRTDLYLPKPIPNAPKPAGKTVTGPPVPRPVSIPIN